eukprot:12427476-Karenia_brevis.AAC.1
MEKMSFPCAADHKSGVPNEYMQMAALAAHAHLLKTGRTIAQWDVLPIAVGLLAKEMPHLTQCRDFVEFMSGKGEFTKAMQGKGLNGVGFDIVNDTSENIIQLSGLLWAAIMVAETVGHN